MKSLYFFCERCFYFAMRLVIGKDRRDKIRYKKQVIKRAKKVKRIGSEALHIFSKVATEENVKFWPFWGTLLGAYREHGFIKHDDDIDVGMFDVDISVNFVDKLIEHGFTILEAIVDKDCKGGYHLAFDYKGIKFDIYSFHEESNLSQVFVFCPLPYNYAKWGYASRKDIFDILHVYLDCWDSFIKIPFEDIELPIPNNTDYILRTLYGDNYMTPIIGQKTENVDNPAKIHENPQKHYACAMNYEVFKMFKELKLL